MSLTNELMQLRHMRAMMVDAYVRLQRRARSAKLGTCYTAQMELVKSLLTMGPRYPGDKDVRGLVSPED